MRAELKETALELKSVLVIESDHETRVAIRKVLENAGHFVVSATNGADAFAILEKITPPKVVLLSSNLPFMSASDFLVQFKESPRFHTIPVAQIISEGEVPLNSACNTIKRPIDPTELLLIISACK